MNHIKSTLTSLQTTAPLVTKVVLKQLSLKAIKTPKIATTPTQLIKFQIKKLLSNQNHHFLLGRKRIMNLSLLFMSRRLLRILRVTQVIVLIEILHRQVICRKHPYVHKIQVMVEVVSQEDQEDLVPIHSYLIQLLKEKQI